MRFFEFANAEAQLGLLRTIIDNTWNAVARQAEEQKRAEAQRRANEKLKQPKRKSTKGKAVKLPTLKPPPALPKPNVVNPQPNPQPNSSNQQSPIKKNNFSKPFNSAALTNPNPSLGV